MVKNSNLLEVSDERNHNRLHQQQRYSVRTENRNKTLSKHSPSSSQVIRSPARSWKKKELVIVQDEDQEFFDLSDDDVGNYYVRYSSYFEESLEKLIRQAITEHDSNYLDILVKHWSIDYNPNPNKRFGFRHRRGIKQHLNTMLTYAITYGDSECIKTILDGIDCGYISLTMVEHVCSNGRTALWYACDKGDLNLVQQLVEQFYANINKCGVLIVAAQNGHQTIVEYLLSKGCDPNRPTKNYNEQALHAAARRNHLGIVKALLKYGADPHIPDRYANRTALDYAIHKRHIDIAKILMHHHAGQFFINSVGFTPLMLAAFRNNTSIVDIFSKILSRQQYLDELVLLACNYTIYGITSKRYRAYDYFERVLSMNTQSYNNVPCEAYEFRRECQTLDELALIRDDDNAMRMHALIISERLLLQNNELYCFLSLLMKQSDVYKWHRLYHRCLHLQLHAYRLILKTDDKNRSDHALHNGYLAALTGILLKILENEGTVPMESLTIIWKWILNRRSKDLVKMLFKLIFITSYLVEMNKLNAIQYRLLFNLVQRTLHQNFTMSDGNFIFSHCIQQIRPNSNDYTYSSISVPILSILRLLIDCRANVDEIRLYTKSTSLHIISQAFSVNATDKRSIIQLLLDANAHTDYTDEYGNLPEDCTDDSEIKEFLRVNRKLSLKCRCAQLINSEKVNYGNSLSSDLIAFVGMHQPRRQISDQGLWSYNGGAANCDTDEQLTKLTKHMREEIKEETGCDQLGLLIIEIDEFNKTKYIYQTLLDATSDSNLRRLVLRQYQLRLTLHHTDDLQCAP